MRHESQSKLPSPHEIKIVRTLQAKPECWFTNNELASIARVARRTARHHTLRLLKSGLLECTAVFGGYRYQWSTKAGRYNPAYIQQLRHAAFVLGMKRKPDVKDHQAGRTDPD
jgi:hypothetical protein